MLNLLKHLIFLVIFTSCIATIPYKGVKCEQITKNTKVCIDRTYSNRCRLHINRKDPYPDTITEAFLCVDTGFLGFSKRKDSWTYKPTSADRR